jgi:hypothetical protein
VKWKHDRAKRRRLSALIARLVRENHRDLDRRRAHLLVYEFEFPVEPLERKPQAELPRKLLADVRL